MLVSAESKSYDKYMKYIRFNPNPIRKSAGDCVVRMLSIITEQSWADAYSELAIKGLEMGEMPSANIVWGQLLQEKGFKRKTIPDTCPVCYTFRDFCFDHPEGTFVVATGTHVAGIIDGRLYDAWDSSEETVAYYFEKSEQEAREL